MALGAGLRSRRRRRRHWRCAVLAPHGSGVRRATRRGCRSAPAPAARAANIRPPTFAPTPRPLLMTPPTGIGTSSAASGRAAARPAVRVLVATGDGYQQRAPTRRVIEVLDYIRDAAEIYRQSFATIRAEADLSRFPDDVARVVVRLIHTCGQVDVTEHVAFSDDVVAKTHAALAAGAPVLVRFVDGGRGHHQVPAARRQRGGVAGRRPAGAADLGRAHSAPPGRPAGVDLWADRLGGAVLAIGNAPTALFRLLELLDDGARGAGGRAGRAGRVRRLRAVQAGADRPAARHVVSGGAGPARRQRDGRRRRECDCERRRECSTGHPLGRRPRARRPGTGDGQGGPADRRGRRRRLPQRPARPQHRARHRRTVPARRVSSRSTWSTR